MHNPGREIIANLSSEWHKLKHGNPIPSLYPQTGAETVMIRGSSEVHGPLVVTEYEIVVTDQGEMVGRYTVRAEEGVKYLKSAREQGS